MGADQSAYQDLELVPQVEPICAIEPRFCLPNPVRLRLTEKPFSFSGDDFKITDADSNVIYFRCAGKAFSLKDKKTLLDNMGVPVLNLKEAIIRLSLDRFTIFAGNDSKKEICKIRTEATWFKAKLTTRFTDTINGQPRHLVLKGNLRTKVAFIYIGEPKQGGVPIGKIYRPTHLFTDSDDYLLEVAPGVDIALLVTLCIALDEHREDK